MNELMAFQTFEEYKQTLTAELTKASESFVRIGYLLKVARDTAILAGTEYKDVNEFAAAEYNLDKTQVSRFIRINDRFSEGGNSDRLQESFRGIGYAKLSMMLLLPDALNEEITPAFSKTEVQALKEEVQAEAEVTPLERMMEPVRPDTESMTMVEKAIYELFRGNQKIYSDVFGGIMRTRPNGDGREMLQEILAPGGEAIHSVRIPGIGRIAISVKGLDRDVMLVNLRSNEKVPCNWDEVLEAACKFVPPDYDSAEAAYKAIFGEPWQAEPEKPAVAPVQPKKETKVTKAVTDKKPEPVKPKIEPVKPAPEPVEPKEPNSGPEPVQAVQEQDIPAAVEKVAKSTESVVEAWKDAAQAADQAAEVAGAFVKEARQAVDQEAEDKRAFAEAIRKAAPVEIPQDPAGCDGQATFNDFPEILPAPEPYRLSENARNWITMWAHNLKTDLINLAESEKANTDALIAAAFPLIRDELLIWHD